MYMYIAFFAIDALGIRKGQLIKKGELMQLYL